MKFNFMKSRNNVVIWKQIEKRDGKTFMRIKQRPIVSVKGGMDNERIC